MNPATTRDQHRTAANLYPGSSSARLDLALFRNPPAEYRGAPFWAWNSRLEHASLLHQLDVFRQMGLGGAFIHPRTGLVTGYLGEAFMGHVRATVEHARSLGLKLWLYDEDRWPSGAAGGIVTRDPAFRARHLLFTPRPYDGLEGEASLISGAFPGRSGNGTLLARYEIELRGGELAGYRRLMDEETAQAGRSVWYAYLETALPSPWFNNQTYVDTLSPAAIERFIEVTHERYLDAVGEHFGGTVPGIFTDEPQFAHKGSLSAANATEDVVLPWTPLLEESYEHRYETKVLDTLPELFWDLPEAHASVARYRYHDHVAELFSSAFADQVGTWCARHGLLLTGHMMEEPTLGSQTASLGEAMRSYRSFDLPGVDMLCDAREYTTVKQAQSAARQYGRAGVTSELYGVTNWDFDFKGHKAQGDWQAALGVTLRAHHLAWVSMAGEAKRDYPASIGYQSPWHAQYPVVEDHFARLNTVLTRGRAVVRIGVVHPIESFWLCFGPLEQTALERAEREERFQELTEWLLFGLHDFDFIAESLLPDLAVPETTTPLVVGEARYDVVLVPSQRTLRSSTLERLERFADAGGQVLFLGEVPTLVDALPSGRAAALAARTAVLDWSRRALDGALRPWREIYCVYPPRDRLSELGQSGLERPDSLLSQVRQDGDTRFVFLCNTDAQDARTAAQLSFRGRWRVTLLDTLSGEECPLPSVWKGSETALTHDFPPHGHALFRLEPEPSASAFPDISDLPDTLPHSPVWEEAGRLDSPVRVSLSEPNVLLLDSAEFRLDDGAWEPALELLRLDTALRGRLGWPLRMEALAQPWATEPWNGAPRRLSLRFTVSSEVSVAAPRLALEGAEMVTVSWNGEAVPAVPGPWWVDECLSTLALPPFGPGEHHLELRLPYTPQTNVEWCYLLGDFGVSVAGAWGTLTSPVRALSFGDWTRQGLPFYAGNVTYHCSLRATGGPVQLELLQVKAALVTAVLDGGEEQALAFAPQRLDLGTPAAGPHSLNLTAYGNRVNAFGAVHLSDARWRWFGPNAWRTVGVQWADEYQLKPMGLLTAPRLLRPEQTGQPVNLIAPPLIHSTET